MPSVTPYAGHDHDAGEAARDDRRLADVEERQRGLVLDRRRLVAGERVIVALGLVGFVAEILHRLEIEKRIDGPGARLLVAGVHFAAEA